MAASKGLTPTEEIFAQHVASGLSQAEAFRMAKPIARNWKDETVWVKASQWMAKDKVRTRVKEIQSEHADRFAITHERVLLEIARLALFDPRNLFNPDGSPKEISDLDDATAAAIAGLEVHEEYAGHGDDRKFIGYTKKYKVADKNAALEKLAKHLGLYEKDNRQKIDPLTELLQQLGGKVLGVAREEGGGHE